MEIQYKHGGIKFTYEAELDELLKKHNLYDMMLSIPYFNIFNDVKFTKSDLDFIKKLYKHLPSDMEDRLGGFETFERYARVKIPNEEVKPYHPDYAETMIASGHDIYNYVARYGLADFQIQAVLRFDGYLDFRRLCNAVRLSVEAQPVLGCRFIENEPPYWGRLANLDEVEFCSFEKTYYLEKAVQNFLETPLDMDRDPMVKLRLIRWGTFDTLCIKMNHACCDGTGTKEYISLLSEIYCAIDKEYGMYIPKPAKRGRGDQDRLFSELGVEDPEAAWIPGSEVTTATWAFPWREAEPNGGRMVVRRLPYGQLDEMIRFSKDSGVTVNDLILTAYYRAMAEMGDPVYGENMELPVTIDLRRYLPDHRTESIRNFSGSEFTRMELVPGESFRDTLSRISSMMKEIKNARPALQSAIGLERVENLTLSETLSYYKMISQWSYYSGNKCAPVLSNLGYVSDQEIKFGRRIATDAYITPPVVRPPGLLLMISSYKGILTLASGFYEDTVERKDIEKLLDKIRDELANGCNTNSNLKSEQPF